MFAALIAIGGLSRYRNVELIYWERVGELLPLSYWMTYIWNHCLVPLRRPFPPTLMDTRKFKSISINETESSNGEKGGRGGCLFRKASWNIRFHYEEQIAAFHPTRIAYWNERCAVWLPERVKNFLESVCCEKKKEVEMDLFSTCRHLAFDLFFIEGKIVKQGADDTSSSLPDNWLTVRCIWRKDGRWWLCFTLKCRSKQCQLRLWAKYKRSCTFLVTSVFGLVFPSDKSIDKSTAHIESNVRVLILPLRHRKYAISKIFLIDCNQQPCTSVTIWPLLN